MMSLLPNFTLLFFGFKGWPAGLAVAPLGGIKTTCSRRPGGAGGAAQTPPGVGHRGWAVQGGTETPKPTSMVQGGTVLGGALRGRRTGARPGRLSSFLGHAENPGASAAPGGKDGACMAKPQLSRLSRHFLGSGVERG